MSQLSPPSYAEHAKRGGPTSALRLTEPGDDPRRLTADPDSFLPIPSVALAVVGLIGLIVTSALGFWFITVAAWSDDPHLPWYAWNLVWSILPWAIVGPFWVWWIRRQLRRSKIHQGREAIASIARGRQPVRGRVTWVSFQDDNAEPSSVSVYRRRIEVLVVAETPSGTSVFVDARTRRLPRRDRFALGDPVWVWEGGGWTFGQIAPHGQDPTYSPADEPQPPTWEDLHGGHSPKYFRTELANLASQYRAGSLTRDEYEEAKDHLLGL